MVADSPRRILVLNSHEAWVAQLDGLPLEFDIVIGLKGRSHSGWDERMRPVPKNARLVTLSEALSTKEPYGAAVAHSVTDLLELRELDIPKLFVIHTTLEGRLAEQESTISPRQLSDETAKYLKLIRAHTMCVSTLKQKSWGLPADIIGFAVDPAQYPQATQELATGIRISNLFNARKNILLSDFHHAAFGDVPVEFVGVNEDMEGVTPASDWDDLKARLKRSRFYIHTADPRLEDGYNMATVEAMAAGLPVLGNVHPSSAIVHGESGFLSDDPTELGNFARQLLGDRELSLRMGQAARMRASELFGRAEFEAKFLKTLARTKAKFHGRLGAQNKKKPKKKRR